MIDILDAARYLVLLSYGKRQYSLTQLKLQKLLYLAQGWSYVWDNKPLFADDFVAWGYGPANEKVYEEFKKYGRSEIPEKEGKDAVSDINAKETLEAVWIEFGKKSAYDLVELTRKQNPWINACFKKTNITNDSIRQYFKSKY